MKTYFDSIGNVLNVGDTFTYTKKKWTSKARIIEHEGELCVRVTNRDEPDKFVLLSKYLSKCEVIKINI